MTDFYNLVERLTRQHRVAVTTDNGHSHTRVAVPLFEGDTE